VTNGLKLSEYRPAGADDAVDIRLRLPEDRRTLSALDELRVQTSQGSVPISNFVVRTPEPTTGILHRIDGARTVVVQANVAAGQQVAAVQAQVSQAVTDMKLEGVRWKLAGSNEDSEEASAFLSKAFGAAIFLIFLVLLAQFNKFTSVWLVLSCVVMATIGVFLGLLLTGQAFGIVMSGIGVIALAGVVVNNNIVLIDTYDRLREEGWDKTEAVLQTCRERARPVVLTAVSAILGVLPIAFGLGLEIFHHETTINAPSTQWWISLSSAIVFGLSFATVLTLVVTPAMLMVFTRAKRQPGAQRSWFSRLFRRGKKDDAATETTPVVTTAEPVAYPKAAE
jgi:multidrug efflux pump